MTLFAFAHLGEVGPLVVAAADDFIAVLNVAFLPPGIGIGVVDGGAGDGVKFRCVDEDDVVVGEDGLHLCAIGGGLLDDAANGPIDVLAGVTLDHSDVGAVIVDTIDHDDERPMAFAARDDGVELPVAGLKTLLSRFREVCVTMLRRMVAGGLGVDITLSAAKTSVTLLPIDHSRDEALSGVVVEGGAGRDVLAISGFFCQAMSGSGDARPLRQFGQKVGHNGGRHFLSGTFLSTAMDSVFLGRVRAVGEVLVADFLLIPELHAHLPIRAPTLKFIPQRRFWHV